MDTTLRNNQSIIKPIYKKQNEKEQLNYLNNIDPSKIINHDIRLNDAFNTNSILSSKQMNQQQFIIERAQIKS
jgi:hypothetical protein